MRRLTLVTYDDLRLAVSFLKRIPDLEDRVNLLLTRNALSGEAGKESAPEGEAKRNPFSGYSLKFGVRTSGVRAQNDCSLQDRDESFQLQFSLSTPW